MSKLYVVGTPIGNLGDFSPRAVKALEEVDFIAAEDTRVTQRLMNFFGVKKPLVSYFEHNKAQKGEYIIGRILGGESCALVTDAGMPAISDPGEELVREARKQGVEVESVPGPTAFATALAISGMPSGRFTFEGFLSQNKTSRRRHLESLENETRTMIFYEAPHKLLNTLKDFEEVFGAERKIAVVREITKIHEESVTSSLREAVKRFEESPPRGEFVLIIEGAKPEKTVMTEEQAVFAAKELINEGMSLSEAAKAASKMSGVKKSEIYVRLLKK